MPTDAMPYCNETYLHQCGKIGEINDSTCTEYCQYPVVSGSTATTASKTIQVQNYFSLKDDGHYTCTVTFPNGISYQSVETMKYPNPKCNEMCVFGIVSSVTSG